MAQSGIKNFALSPAATDLGLGDVLQSQLSDASDEARKQALLKKRLNQGNQPMSPATQQLFQFLNGGTLG